MRSGFAAELSSSLAGAAGTRIGLPWLRGDGDSYGMTAGQVHWHPGFLYRGSIERALHDGGARSPQRHTERHVAVLDAAEGHRSEARRQVRAEDNAVGFEVHPEDAAVEHGEIGGGGPGLAGFAAPELPHLDAAVGLTRYGMVYLTEVLAAKRARREVLQLVIKNIDSSARGRGQRPESWICGHTVPQ